jgi:UDP-2,3-diacylglucosamine pyrophosphatase LpxH
VDKEPNIIVASDLHLTLSLDENDRETDREIELFLRHYAEQRIDGRPWRLVFAGDTFDFLFPAMALFVERYPGDDAPAMGTSRFVEHWDVPAICWRLRKTLRDHEAPFAALGDFLLAGNEAVFLKGNHDVDLQWFKVQKALLQELHRLLVEKGRKVEEKQLAGRIHFLDWFYYEPGTVYIEHGCQYDELNAFPNFLDPALVHDPERSFAPIGSRMVLYLTNAFPDYRPQPESGAFMKYIRRTGQLFSRKFLGRSLKVVRHSLFFAGLFSEEGWKTTGGSEDRFLSDLSAKTGIPIDRLQQLQGFQARPVTAVRGFFYSRMFLDRLFVALFGILVLAVALIFGVFRWSEPSLLWLAGTSPVALLISILLRRKRRHLPVWYQWLVVFTICTGSILVPFLLGGGTPVGAFLVTFTALVVGISLIIMPLTEVRDLRGFLRQTAMKIHETLGVSLVIFGHRHRADRLVKPGTDTEVYLNVGAWVSSGIQRNHSHAVLTRRPEGGLASRLYRGREYLDGGEASHESC